MNTKKIGRPREIDKVYKRKGRLEDFNTHGRQLYQEILEEIIVDHNIPKFEILKKFRKRKNEIKNKKETSQITGITQQKIYETLKGTSIPESWFIFI